MASARTAFQAIGHPVLLVLSPCPPSPPAPRAWPTCGWRRAFAPSVCPHPKQLPKFAPSSPSSCHLLLSLESGRSPPTARPGDFERASEKQVASSRKAEVGRNHGLPQVCFAQSRMVRGRGRAWRGGEAWGGRRGAGGPVSRAPRPPPPPPWTVSGLSPGS